MSFVSRRNLLTAACGAAGAVLMPHSLKAQAAAPVPFESLPHPRGLMMPQDVVQPFFLRFRRDDLHVMAFFAGHPAYEAVEAMIRFRDDGTPSIRAIVTRHNQSQIDHVNDPRLLAEGRSVDRQTCYRDIDFTTTAKDHQRHARLAFLSFADEPVVLDLTTVGPPSKDRRGLSDPGRHSPTSSLPIMWREASTLAGPQTHVTIDGNIFDVPVKLLAPGFVAHEGYYTEHHAMAVIRAGSVTSILRRKPERIAVGAQWIFEQDDQEIIYRVAARDDSGHCVIEKNDGGDETIKALAAEGRLDISEIRRWGDNRRQGGFTMAFTGNSRFSLSIDAVSDLVTGTVGIVDEPNRSLISLMPSQPDWAVARRVDVDCSRNGDRLTCLTTIGRAVDQATGEDLEAKSKSEAAPAAE